MKLTHCSSTKADEEVLFEDMALATGTRLGRYEIRSLLGMGGMGEVYLARDTTLRRFAAVKLLPAHFTSDEERLRRFEREAYAASTLNHPNILTVYEIGVEEGHHFIATELIEGESLRQHMGNARLELREILDIGIQVASALAAAHAAGIIHRDIKPENIMLRGDGIAKVLDFGLAKLVRQEPPAHDAGAPTEPMPSTAHGVVMGTVSYMSPEQARGQVVDARTDIWSLGVVLYEMVAERLPFEGATASDVIASVLKTEPPIVTRYAPQIPTELERIVTKALRKNKEERYQVVNDLGLDLKSLKGRLEFEAELERTDTPEQVSASRSVAAGDQPTIIDTAQTASDIHATSSAEYVVNEIKRHKRGALLLLAVLLAATVGVAYFTYSRRSARSGEAGIGSIAVLPFTNTSKDPDAEYLSDGISESLINNLSQLPGLKVIARSSSFKYKGKDADPQEVARALNVEAVLSGRVSQRGENLLISAELMDARDETQMWGGQYNRLATDLLSVQTEISREIAEKLRLRLSADEGRQLAKRETVNPAAYELLLKGRFYYNKLTPEDAKKAVEYFQQAIAVDPAYSPAYAELSASYISLIRIGIVDPQEFTRKAEAAARKALELDESLAEAHDALANLKVDAWDWATAEREFKRAIELNPNYARAHMGYAYHLSFAGRHEQAIAEIKRARELDPLSLNVNVSVGFILHFARRYDEAIEALQKTREMDRNSFVPHIYLGYTYAAKGMYREAIAAYQETIKLEGVIPSTQIYLGAACAQAGERERARTILKQLQTSKEYVSPGELAILYAALGEREQAFASLEKAYAAHDFQLQYLGVDPAFDPLRSDPRFQDLLRRVGFTP